MNYFEIKQALVNCVGLQDKMNTIFNKTPETPWLDNHNDWSTATLVEVGEFIDHVGFKWWKGQPFNKPQAFMELVDIFHFQLSLILQVTHDFNDAQVNNAAVDIIMGKVAFSLIDAAEEYPVIEDRKEINALAKGFRFDDHGYEDNLVLMFQLAGAIGYTLQDIFSIYTVKNTLNEFRQLNGDREGKYVKVWEGREDNEVVTELVKNDPSLITNLDELKSQIAKKYSIVTNTMF